MHQLQSTLRLIGIRGTSPYIRLTGCINRETTIFVSDMLEKMPTSANQLSVVIDCEEGSYSQALIIAQKLQHFAKKKQINLVTIAGDYATNAGFFLLSCGHTVVVDSCSIVGGLETVVRKTQLPIDMMETISYTENSTFSSDLADVNRPFTESNKSEIEPILTDFGQKAVNQVLKWREGRIKAGSSQLFGFYNGSEALKLGLADRVGNLINVVDPERKSFQLQESSFELVRKELRKLRFL